MSEFVIIPTHSYHQTRARVSAMLVELDKGQPENTSTEQVDMITTTVLALAHESKIAMDPDGWITEPEENLRSVVKGCWSELPNIRIEKKPESRSKVSLPNWKFFAIIALIVAIIGVKLI